METDKPSHDLRGGDEDIIEPKENMDSHNADPANASCSSSKAVSETEKENPPPPERKFTLPPSLAWIPANLTWSQLKPVIRCSLSAWVSIVFAIIGPVSRSLGQASFLLIISAFLSPPQGPFISVLEREVYVVFFVTVSWAWSCLGIKLASLARSEIITTPDPTMLFSGGYLEAGPTAIMAVFLFIGSAVLLYIKASHPPGPLLFATIFGCIAIDIIFLTAVLFPFPFYTIGQAVVLPIALYSGIALFFSATVFPSTISSFYISKCHGILLPLRSALQEHRRLLQTSTESPEFIPTKANKFAAASEAGLVPVTSAIYLLKRDVVWCRFSPSDFEKLHDYARRMVVRISGMCAYFGVIDPTRERLTTTPAHSISETPARSPGPSPSASLHHEASGTNVTETPRAPLEYTLTMDSSVTPAPTITDSPTQPGSIRNARRRNTRTRHPRFSESKTSSTQREHIHYQPHHRHKHLVSHGPLLPLVVGGHNSSQPAVGLYESIRYADLEEKLSHPAAACNTEKFHRLLKECCDDMLGVADETLGALDGWLNTATNKSRFKFWGNKAERQRIEKEKVDGYVQLKEKMDRVLEVFEKEKRHIVVDPYRASLNAKAGSGDASDAPSHRHLFHCYVYQYHLWQFLKVLSELLGEVIRLENERTEFKLWVPTLPWRRLLAREGLDTSDDIENDDDEDPDVIQGMQREDLGHARMRDPDALPPRNAFEWIMNALYRGCSELVQGNSLYAIKAGVLSILLSVPGFTPSSAKFAWDNRLVWGVIMGQLTLVRFRGDTSAGLISRLLGTMFGVFVGAALWYMSTGLGRGNAYGLAAVCGGLFPLMIFGRLYWPGSPMTNILFFVTSMLVIGYSWYNTHPIPPATFPHWGIDLAIRRLILVAVGVAAAFIFSFLPPSTTLRKYQRTTLATATGELGAIYCSIVSFANTGEHTDQDIQQIVQGLVAIRAKLKRSLVLKENIIFEFSLRGRWPAERYQKILDIQLKIAYHLSYLMSVVIQFEPAWSRAFLRRCRFLDSEFQGEMLAVISLISTALRSGMPIPQITPCPLLNRFLRYNHGFDVVRGEDDDEYGLPRTATVDLLEDEQYMYYCVGVSTAFSIVNNLDKLMVATKELVGEQYHIHGIGIARKGGYEAPPTPGSTYPNPSKEV